MQDYLTPVPVMIDNQFVAAFNENYENLVRFAIERKIYRPEKKDMINAIILKAGIVDPELYFSELKQFGSLGPGSNSILYGAAHALFNQNMQILKDFSNSNTLKGWKGKATKITLWYFIFLKGMPVTYDDIKTAMFTEADLTGVV